MSTIRDHVEAMGVPPDQLEDTDEYFEVVHTLVVGSAGSVVYKHAHLINPDCVLEPTDTVQVRRRIGMLSDPAGTITTPEPPRVDLDAEITADTPVLYLPDVAVFDGAQTKIPHPGLGFDAAFTLEASVKLTGQGTVGGKDYGTVFGYSATRRLLAHTSGKILAQLSGQNLSTPPGLFGVGERFHLAYVFTETHELVFINGIQTAMLPATAASFTSAFWEGAYGDPSKDYSFKGELDHRAFYDHALTADRILKHAQAT